MTAHRRGGWRERAGRAVAMSATTLALLEACTPAGGVAGGTPAAPPAPAAPGTPTGIAPASPTALGDSAGLVPPGYGTLRQDDIALRVQHLGLQIRAVPLDEAVIRLLSPDSYRALRELRESRRSTVLDAARRGGARTASVWMVSFFATEQGTTRFVPTDVTISNVGRDFRPVDAIGLTPGFGEQQVAQRETQSALLVFDGELDPFQPLTLAYQGERTTEWDAVIRRLERERTLVRSRATRG